MTHEPGGVLRDPALQNNPVEHDPIELDLVYDAIVATGIVTPLSSGRDEKDWLDCDLASFAENRIGDAADPREIDPNRRATWLERAVIERLILPSDRPNERCFWLVDKGQRVGSVALSATLVDARFVHLSSLYVYPWARGRSIARQTLGVVRDVLARYGIGVQLWTHWTWNRAASLYSRMGMWVRNWKCDIELAWDARVPNPQISVSPTEATLSVTPAATESDDSLPASHLANRSVVLARARREGNRLVQFEVQKAQKAQHLIFGDSALHASSTLSLAIALQGWPLIRSDQHWRDMFAVEAGPPEGLAYRIIAWEAWEHHHKFNVTAPRLPGLPYLTREQLEEHWRSQKPG